MMTEKQRRRGIVTSVAELEEKIMQFIESYNQSPQPVVWTKTTEEIVKKVGRAREKLNNLQLI